MIDGVSGSSYVGGWHTVQVDSMEILPNQDFFIGIRFNNNGYVMAFDNMGDLSGRSYYSTNGISYSNGLSEHGDCNIRAKVSTETFVKTNDNSYIPTKIKLYPNFPNPFNPTTQISFSMEKESKVLLEIYDINGRKIETLINNQNTNGVQMVNWNASKYSSGVYFVKLSDGKSLLTQKLMLMK